MTWWLTILQIGLDVVGAKFNNRAVDVAGASLRIISAARAAYTAETGQPVDESKIPPFEPIA